MSKIFKSAVCASLILTGSVCGISTAKAAFEERPSLIISSEDTAPEVLYNRGSADVAVMAPMTPMSMTMGQPMQITAPVATQGYVESNVALDKPFDLIRSHKPTPVTAKVDAIAADLADLQSEVTTKESRLSALNRTSEDIAKDYYALVAGMSAKLQSGTTRGNPDLIESWEAAQNALNALGDTSSDLARLGNEITDEASRAAMMSDTIQGTFALSGARDEDHENLIILEDRANETLARLDRLVSNVNDEINRRTAYLRSERLNMQTLSLAIENGDLYGGNIRNRMFKTAEMASAGPAAMPVSYAGGSYGAMSPREPLSPVLNTDTHMASFSPMAMPGRKPLVIIRFDKPNLQYENALYGAVNQALDKRPNVMFDVVTITPASGNSAEMALNANAARRNGEDVLRALTQMGVPMDRVNLSSGNSASARFSEVHIFIR